MTVEQTVGDDRESRVSRRLALWGVSGAGVVFLALLVLADALVILLHLTHGFYDEPGHPAFDLAIERGFGEFLQYAKGLWATALLVALAVSRRALLLLAWAGVLGGYLLDDVLMLHETVGEYVAELLPIPGPWLRYSQPMGELVYLGVLGLVAVVTLALLHRRATAVTRVLSRRLARCAILLVVVGVGVDAGHAVVAGDDPGSPPDVLLTALEDGGELLVLSVMVAILFTTMVSRMLARPRPVARDQWGAGAAGPAE